MEQLAAAVPETRVTVVDGGDEALAALVKADFEYHVAVLDAPQQFTGKRPEAGAAVGGGGGQRFSVWTERERREGLSLQTMGRERALDGKRETRRRFDFHRQWRGKERGGRL